MSDKLELKEGQEVTINIPFTYTIGEEGPVTGDTLKTIEDCKEEVRQEIYNRNLNNGEILLTVENPS